MSGNLEYSLLAPNADIERVDELVLALCASSPKWIGRPVQIRCFTFDTGGSRDGLPGELPQFIRALRDGQVIHLYGQTGDQNCRNSISVMRNGDCVLYTLSVAMRDVLKLAVPEVEMWLCTPFHQALAFHSCLGTVVSEVGPELECSPLERLVEAAFHRSRDWLWVLVPADCLSGVVPGLTLAKTGPIFSLLRNQLAVDAWFEDDKQLPEFRKRLDLNQANAGQFSASGVAIFSAQRRRGPA